MWSRINKIVKWKSETFIHYFTNGFESGKRLLFPRRLKPLLTFTCTSLVHSYLSVFTDMDDRLTVFWYAVGRCGGHEIVCRLVACLMNLDCCGAIANYLAPSFILPIKVIIFLSRTNNRRWTGVFYLWTENVVVSFRTMSCFFFVPSCDRTSEQQW